MFKHASPVIVDFQSLVYENKKKMFCFPIYIFRSYVENHINKKCFKFNGKKKQKSFDILL